MNQAIREPIEHTTGETMPAATHRRRTWLLGGLAGAIALAALLAWWWSSGRFLEGTDDAYVRADWVAVSAQVSGYVAEVLVADDADVRPATCCCAWTRATSASAYAPPRPAKRRRRRRWKPSARSWRPSIGNCWSRCRRSAAPAPMAKRREPNGAAPRPTGDATGNWPTSMPPVASAWRMPTRRTSERGRRRGGQAPRKAASAPPGTY